ncbi:putative methionine--tRNA ligase, mitochondrial [Convolutriloba macropyga]|uniref:putative methionine--tRNA ligase, mitochondrial n=1 Tax=Convolutriloba macropyga TaxID=536237 RepID=UPI003F524D6D
MVCKFGNVFNVRFCRHAITKSFADRSAHYVITTPIYYVNSSPHIGHAYTSLLADVIGRWRNVKNSDSVHVFLACGTDEHGSKVLEAAKETPVSIFCDQQARVFQSLLDDLNINYHAFIRTTTEFHKNNVNSFWRKLIESGAIEKGVYRGWYSVNDEEFLAERDTELQSKKDGTQVRVSKSSGHEVCEIEENNYLFNLEPYKERVLSALKVGFVKPLPFAELVELWIMNEKVMDHKLSVSRPTSRCHWGIQVPDDPSQTIYVWLDALVSYLTATENKYIDKFWPAELQIVGKDILKFHAVYWPSFLLAAGYELPKAILCHSHWLCDGQKMSKTKGNVVDPFKYLGQTNSDYLRLYLIARSHLTRDGNFSHRCFIELIDYFANSYGNAAGRVMNKKCLEVIGNMYPYPSDLDLSEALSLSGSLVSETENAVLRIQENYENYMFNSAWEEISRVLHTLNKFLQDSKFWKRYDDANYVRSVVYLTFECLRCCSIMLSPIVPLTTFELLERLSIRPNEIIHPYCRMYVEANADPPWSGRELMYDNVRLVRKMQIED